MRTGIATSIVCGMMIVAAFAVGLAAGVVIGTEHVLAFTDEELLGIDYSIQSIRTSAVQATAAADDAGVELMNLRREFDDFRHDMVQAVNDWNR